MRAASCKGTAPTNGGHDPFFPGRGETSEQAIIKYCFKCTVRSKCEDYGNRIGARTGIWGGKRRTRETHK